MHQWLVCIVMLFITKYFAVLLFYFCFFIVIYCFVLLSTNAVYCTTILTAFHYKSLIINFLYVFSVVYTFLTNVYIIICRLNDYNSAYLVGKHIVCICVQFYNILYIYIVGWFRYIIYIVRSIYNHSYCIYMVLNVL